MIAKKQRKIQFSEIDSLPNKDKKIIKKKNQIKSLLEPKRGDKDIRPHTRWKKRRIKKAFKQLEIPIQGVMLLGKSKIVFKVSPFATRIQIAYITDESLFERVDFSTKFHFQIQKNDSELSLEESNFKVKFTRLTNYADYETSSCDVCCQKNDKYFPEGEEKGVKMMVCYGCGVKCHAYCYGIDSVTKEEIIKGKADSTVLYFVCEKCRLEPKKAVNCVVCNQKKGALKKLDNSTHNEWVHVTCGLYNGGIIVTTDYRQMKFSKANSSQIIEKDKKSKTACNFCKSDVGLRKCFSENCNQHAHVYCTLKYMQEKEANEGEDPEWFVRLNYVQNTQYNVESGCLMSSDITFHNALRSSLNEISQIIMGIPVFSKESSETNEINPQASKQSQQKNARSSRRNQNEEKNLTSDQLTMAEEQSLGEGEQQTLLYQQRIKYQSVVLNIGNKILKNLESADNQDKEFNKEKQLLGGEISFECPDHRRQEVYCICQKAESSEDFVQCELCNDWYHYGCVNFSKKQADSSEKYRCPMCDEWYSHKKRRLLKEFGSGKADTCDILVGNVPKFNLMDFISVALFTDTRIGILISNTKKQPSESVINDVVSALSFIPLFSSKLQDLGLFKSKKYIQEGLNQFLTGIQEETDILKPVSAISITQNPTSFTIIEEKSTQNEQIKKQIDEISQLYSRCQAKEKGILTNLKKPVNWMTRVHSQFFQKGLDKISPLILNDFTREDEESITCHSEYKYLEELQISFKNWNAKLLAVYEDILQQAIQKQASEEQSIPSNPKEKIEIDEEQFIIKKYDKWRERLSVKPTLSEIDQLISEGRGLAVDCSQDIKKLEFEKEEVEVWCQVFEEFQRNSQNVLAQLKARNIQDKDSKNEGDTMELEGKSENNYTTESPELLISRNQQLTSKGDFEIQALKMMTKVLLQVPRMEAIVEMMQTYELNQLKWEGITEFISSFSALSHKGSSSLDKISSLELESLLNSSLSLPIKSLYLSQLYGLIDEQSRLKEKIKAVISAEFNETSYQQIHTDIQSSYFFFPTEEQTIEEHLRAFKEISELFVDGQLLRKVTAEQISSWVAHAKAGKFPEQIVASLVEKFQSVIEIMEQLSTISKNGVVEREQLALAKELEDKMRMIKTVDFKKEMDLIAKLEKSNSWFRNLHKFAFHLTSETALLPASQRIQHIDLELEDILDSKTIGECDEDIESRVSIIKNFFDSLGVELFQLVKEGLTIDYHADKRIQNRLTSLALLCWTFDTESLLNKPVPMKIEQMIPAIQNAIFMKVDQENETFKRLNGIYQKALQERKEQEIINQNKLLQLEKEQGKTKEGNNNQKKIIINPDSSDDDEEFDEEDSDCEEDDSDSYESDDGEDIQKKKEQIEIENSEEDANEISGDEQPEDNSGLNSEDSEKYAKIVKLGIKWNETVEDYLSQISKQNIGNNDKTITVESSQKSTISFQQLKDVLQEGYGLIHDILLLKKSVGFLKKNMLKLEIIIEKVDQQLQRINEIRDADKVNDSMLVENSIDVSDLLIEYKVSLESSPNIVISIKNLLKKPFNSLYKFKSAYNKLSETSYFSKSNESKLEKQKNESERKNQLKKIKKDQQQQDSKKKSKSKNMNDKDDLIEIESPVAETGQNKNISDSKQNNDSQGISLRQRSNRHRVKARDEDFVYGSNFVKQINKEEDKIEIKSKVNSSSHKKKSETAGNSNESAKHGQIEKSQQKQQPILEASDIDEEEDDDSANLEKIVKTDFVSDEDRKRSQELLKKNINQNPIFSQIGQNPFKSIENQIFGEFHKNRKKYLVKIDQYSKMFVQLITLPLISKKILGKNFSTVTLDKLVNNQNLALLEKTVKQQINLQKQQQQQQQSNQNPTKPTQPNATSNSSNNSGSNTKINQIPNKPTVSTAASGSTSSAKTTNNNTQQSSKEAQLNSSKEPLPSKKFKSVDPLEKFLPPAPSSDTKQTAASSALSSLLFKNEKESSSSSSRQKDNRHSSKHDKHDRDDRYDRHSKHNRKDRSRYSSSPSQNSRYKNKNRNDSYSTSNNNKKRHSSNQGNFSDESDSNDNRQDTKQQQQQQFNSSKSNKSYPQDDSKKPHGFDPDADKKSQNTNSKYSQHHESSQTPVKQIFVNKSDIEDIDQIQSTYISDSKVYQLDKMLLNTHKADLQSSSPKNQEILFNPDADDDDADHDKEEQDIQALNKQYFDQEDELQIGLSSMTKISKSQTYPISSGNSSEKQKLTNIEHETETIASPSSPVGVSKLQYDKKPSKENEQPTMEIEEIDEPTPEGCVIRIAKCRIRTSKGASSLPAAMYTMNSVKELKKFPLIDTSKAFEINSYTDFAQIKNYLDKQVNKSIIVLKGWFELQNPKSDSKRLLDAIKIQDSKDKVSGFKINGMTFNVFTERLIQKTDYKFTPKPCSSELTALLPFVIYKKKSDPSPLSIGGPINPFKFVKFVEDQKSTIGSKNSKSSSIQEQQILSPISSEDEDMHERIEAKDLKKFDSLFQDKDTINVKKGQDSAAAAAASANVNIDLKILQDIDLQSIQMQLLDLPTEIDPPVNEGPSNTYSRQAPAAPLRQYIPQQNYQNNNMPQYSRMNQPMHNYQHPPPPPRHHLQYPPLYPQSQPSYLNHPNPPYINQQSLPQPLQQQTVFNPQEQEKQNYVNDIPENSEKKDNVPKILSETAIDQSKMNIEEEIPDHPELDFKDIDFDLVQTLLQDDKAEQSSEKLPSNDQTISPHQLQPVMTFGRQPSLQDPVSNPFYPPENAIPTTDQNSTQNIQQLLLSQRTQPLETPQQPSQLPQQQPSGFSQNYQAKQQYPPYLPPNSAPPPPHLNQLQQPQQWSSAPSQMYTGGMQGKGYGGYPGKFNPNNGSNNLIPSTQVSSSQGSSLQSQGPSYVGANGRGYPPNQNLGTGNPRGNMRYPPNASNYGNNTYNSGQPNNQQARNYIKYERGGSNQGKQLPSSQQQQMQQQQAQQQMQPQQQQYKNHFGSRQQAHYQRNNQPYTAHNPVPFEATDQQQQSSIPDRDTQKD